ncbi:DUF4870 domain-containing protein [Candidatus Gottesmanbacteria bacterium]|nr:DUF4870 domain-containing protein [Candidatus Gottesmanbacteria bacterium]
MPSAKNEVVSKSNKNMMAAAAYLLGFVTGVVLLLVEKEDKFVRFHAMQSTITFGLLFLVGLVPLVGWLVGVVLAPLSLILWLVLMWKAYQGEMFKLPVIGDLAEKQLEKLK